MDLHVDTDRSARLGVAIATLDTVTWGPEPTTEAPARRTPRRKG